MGVIVVVFVVDFVRRQRSALWSRPNNGGTCGRGATFWVRHCVGSLGGGSFRRVATNDRNLISPSLHGGDLLTVHRGQYTGSHTKATGSATPRRRYDTSRRVVIFLITHGENPLGRAVLDPTLIRNVCLGFAFGVAVVQKRFLRGVQSKSAAKQEALEKVLWSASNNAPKAKPAETLQSTARRDNTKDQHGLLFQQRRPGDTNVAGSTCGSPHSGW
jgi:hypothetical protein